MPCRNFTFTLRKKAAGEPLGETNVAISGKTGQQLFSTLKIGAIFMVPFHIVIGDVVSANVRRFWRQKTAAPITSAAVSGLARVPQLRTIRRYFTLTRRKNAGGAPLGMTVALAFLAYVRRLCRRCDQPQYFSSSRATICAGVTTMGF